MATDAKKPSDKPPKNIVHEQAILVETIKKELREQKLYENFSINPFTKREILAAKPNTYPDLVQDEADSTFIEMIKRANLEPTKKFQYPQTSAQEIGWLTTPLLDVDKNDRRFNFNRHRSEISAYAEEYYKMFPKKPAGPVAAGGAPPPK
ncbi:unnamed protein product [Brachionus calyciflorus]|uniref:Uncharacterized protein n=1 Tax=Brachionus calyciflorus TaxID=104777 RepID=A0A813U5A4_9BILA|nr:unnamed protein product [Brachionus calyciflorus]